jgi:hypothetical protein
MRRSIERCVGNAGELPVEVWSGSVFPGYHPDAGMDARNKRADNSDETHQSDRMGLKVECANPSPERAIAALQRTSDKIIEQ